jgi:UPF0716 protein FxsA
VLPLLAVLFIAVPIVELYVLIQIGQEIGALWTVAILVADSILGSVLMRSQGRATWRRFNDALAAGRPPAREVLDGVLVIFGGALLLTPGFMTDILGLLLLLPPTRAFFRGFLVRRLGPRLVVSAAGRWPRGHRPWEDRPGGDSPARGRRRAFDVDGTASEIDDPPRRLP